MHEDADKLLIKSLYKNFVEISLETCASPSAGKGDIARIYNLEQLRSLHGSVISMAMGSGNPTSMIKFNQGDLVIDIGCGIGIDCFLASQQVGAQGNVIGIDITHEIINLALNAKQVMNVENISFLNGDMQNLPLKNEVADVIIGNFSISNLPTPQNIFPEMFRVLKHGASFCFSDMVIHDCPEKGKKASLLWPFSVASLVEPDKYLKDLIDNGFCDISIADQGKIQTNQGDIESITISGKKPTR